MKLTVMMFDRAQLSIMKKQKIIRYLRSIIAVPIIMATLPLSGIIPIIKSNIVPTIITKENSVIITQEEVIRNKKANILNNFFAKYKAPLAGYGMTFVVNAEKNNIDWRLLPAIAMRETTGGKYSCKNSQAPNNNFGWFSCRRGFSSVNKSIEFISMTIGGNNPNSKYYNKDMTTEQILKTYNPDYIVPGYYRQVIRIMEMINSNKKVV